MKIVFDIACGIGDFRAYILCPPTANDFSKSTKKQLCIVTNRLQIHVPDTVKDILGNSSWGMSPPPGGEEVCAWPRRLCVKHYRCVF